MQRKTESREEAGKKIESEAKDQDEDRERERGRQARRLNVGKSLIKQQGTQNMLETNKDMEFEPCGEKAWKMCIKMIRMYIDNHCRRFVKN